MTSLVRDFSVFLGGMVGTSFAIFFLEGIWVLTR